MTLREIAQRRQEDFYAAWVGEMIRVAKPGAPIVVEHVSQPKCDDREDWGRFDDGGFCNAQDTILLCSSVFLVVTKALTCLSLVASGGVSKSWWTSVAIERYNWPIDPTSIFMEDDHIYTFKRYHVFMRKLE